MEQEIDTKPRLNWLKQRLNAIPAGIMLLPLLFGSLIHTLWPEALEIGSYTTALFSSQGAATLMALQLFCIGTQIRLVQVSGILKRGGTLLAARAIAGVLSALLFRLFANDGMIAGISMLAAVAACSNTNGSIFIATTALLKEDEAAAAAPILALSNGPLLTALILGASGAASFDSAAILGLVIPMLIGIVAGNISNRVARFFAPGVTLTLPLIGFALGAGIDLGQIWHGGCSGILLALGAVLLGGAVAFALDRLSGGSGTAGIAASATGANAIAVPAALALTNPAWLPVSAAATAQISAAVLISALAIPSLAGLWSNRNRKRAAKCTHLR